MLVAISIAVLILAAAVAVVVIGAPHVERSLMYAVNPAYSTPQKASAGAFEERLLETPDGERLVTWYSPPKPGEPTLLYVHGNAGTLADRAERISAYAERGRGLLIMAYRGYSGSSGAPSEKANVSDAVLAYDTLRGYGIEAEDIFAYGESIGTGIVVQLATRRPVAGLILDAPYTSIVDVAEIFYPYLPARLMMRDRYETLKHLAGVSSPMLVIHGERDRVIPVEMGRKVAESSRGPSEIVTFPEAGHSDHSQHGSFAAVNSWIDRQRRSSSRRYQEAG